MIVRSALLLTLSWAPLAAAASDLDRLAEVALTADDDAAEVAIAALRDAGGEGMERALALYDRELGADSDRLDRICGVRDCAASRLFWYTDLEAAVAEARRTAKPILSLRLLGRLDEDLSCANSRFFRTTLYPDRRVSSYLRENFVLHWRSVRPVPVVRIDFGDGRVLERTLTGNSIHYVLDSDGRLVDALPGLYAADVFWRELDKVVFDLPEAGELTPAESEHWAREYSQRRLRQLAGGLRFDRIRHAYDRSRSEWTGEPQAAGAQGESVDPRLAAAPPPAPNVPVPDSIVTVSQLPGPALAMTKARAEIPMLAQVARPEATEVPELFAELASLYVEQARLDEPSRRLVLAKEGPLTADEAEALFDNLARDTALDTVINQYDLRRRIHELLAERPRPLDLEAFNAEVYETLFAMPADDPWLGLAPASVFSALPAGGRRTGTR